MNCTEFFTGNGSEIERELIDLDKNCMLFSDTESCTKLDMIIECTSLKNATKVSLPIPVVTSKFLIGLLCPFIFAFGSVGNAIVAWVSLCNKASPTNTFLASLAFADLMFLIGCLPFMSVFYYTKIWYFGDIMCKCLKIIYLKDNFFFIQAKKKYFF